MVFPWPWGTSARESTTTPARCFPAPFVSAESFQTWWTFRIFFIYFFARGGGIGESEAPGGRGVFFIENPRRGGEEEGGAEGPGGCLRRIGEFGGGGAKYFFSETSSKQMNPCLETVERPQSVEKQGEAVCSRV